MNRGSWIPLIAFLFALIGILYEYILAQYVMALLGGGYNVLFFIFCIFAFFLGFGAFVVTRFQNLSFKTLVQIQILLGVLGICVPLYYQQLQQLELSTLLTFFLALLPIASIGFLTGFEIPVLYKVSREKIERILTFDYIGMSLGILLFPYLALQWMKIDQLTYCLSILSFFSAAVIYKHQNLGATTQLMENPASPKTSPLSTLELSILSFLFSFCSFSYQGLIGKTINSTLSDHYLINYYSIGIFIIGLALGAYKADKNNVNSQQAGVRLFYTEVKLVSFVSLTPLLIFLSLGLFYLIEGPLLQITEKQYLLFGFGILSLLPFGVGYLTGQELPLLIQWSSYPSGHKTTLIILAANYSAALFAGAVIGFLAGHYTGVTSTYLPVIILNLLACFYIMIPSLGLNLRSFSLLMLSLFFVTGHALLSLPARQFFLDAYYSKAAISGLNKESFRNTWELVQKSGQNWRYESYFQNIDLKIILQSEVEGQRDSFSLFLNKQPQFNSLNIESYHLSMVYAAQRLHQGDINNILILGGGDGILARFCIEHFPGIPITLIELDPKIISLAKNNYHFIELNKKSLEHPDVHLIEGDAYQFVRKSGKQFDLVFIDFPYPTNLDISRLYSVEFYQGLHRSLSARGLAIIDAPILVDFKSQEKKSFKIVQQLISTLNYSGFTNPFPFGPYDPFFAVAKDNRILSFNDDNNIKNIPTPIFLNLHSLEHMIPSHLYKNEAVNFVLSPTILEL